MPLCNACNCFASKAFLPPQQKAEFPWFRTQLPHLRISEIVKSAASCDVCALLKNGSIRAFRDYMKDDRDSTFLDFMAMNFPDEPTSLVLNQDQYHEQDQEPPRSTAILLQFPDPPLNDTKHRGVGENVHLRIWAAEDSPASLSGDVCDVPPIRDDNSTDVPTLVGSWLSNCIESHVGWRCTQTLSGAVIDESIAGALPTRVIDVTHSNGHSFVRLLETNDLKDHYVALSHCWGPREKQPIRTLKGNIKQHISGIAMADLPKTFYQAVEITRALGIPYLWIDSLCIIQDDEDDWKREAKTMGALYEKARLTIAATDATDSSKGLFLGGRQSTDPVVEIPFRPNGKDSEGVIYVTAGARSYYSFDSSPLEERAWVYQERYFSRRILHCTDAGLLWYCKSQWNDHDGSDYTVDERDMPQLTDTILTRSWQEDIEVYTERRMTYESDRLAAVEGLASEMSKTRPDAYHVGIWMNELPCSLLWLRIRQFVIHDPSDHRQPHIPSWSWASIAGRKWFIEDYDVWDDRLAGQRVFLSINNTRAMSSPLLAGTAAGDDDILIVDSYLKKANVDNDSFEFIEGTLNDDELPDHINGAPPIPLILFLWSGAYNIIDGKGKVIGRATFDVAYKGEIYCLFLCNGQPYERERETEWHRKDWFHHVMLLESAAEASTFRRVGLGLITLQTWFEGQEVQRIFLK